MNSVFHNFYKINLEVKDNTIWKKFKDGDRHSQSVVYEQYVNKLYSYGFKICANDSLIKDCIHEVFIQLIERKENLIITEYTHLYLFKSLRNKILEELRTSNRRKITSQEVIDKSSTMVVSVEQSIVQNEEEQIRLEMMHAAIGQLTDYQREAIFLRYSQDFGYEEIAEILNIDVSSVRTLIYRSLKKVRENLTSKI